MEKTIEIPEGYEARIEGNKVIFEPKESEDERTVEWLIKFVGIHLPDAAEFEPEYRAALAYLEKQKEQNPANIKRLLQAEYKKGWDKALLQLPKEVDSQIWQIANNSAKTWEESFAILCATQKAYDKGKEDVLKEQKHAEWSEEDEKMLGNIINVLDNYIEISGDTRREFSRFLKSLRPQPSWKPSEEQPEVDLEKFAKKMDAWKARYNYPDNIPIKAAMAFTARMFYQYPNVARRWYDSLPKAIMD